MSPIDMRLVHLWLGLAHPFYGPLTFATMMMNVAAVGPIYAGLAWQGAWLDVLNEAARHDKKER
jgi:hypothetical protein